MKIWTVANQKGGVGKTTTAVSLSGLLSTWGFRTLMIDLDPHGSLTSYFGHDPDEVQDSVYTLFQSVSQGTGEDPTPLIRRTKVEGLDLLPAATALATLERQSRARDGMGLTIRRALHTIEHKYENVVIDCPPMLGVLMINALAACEHLIIPVQTEFLAIKGLDRMLRTMDMVLKSRRVPLPYTIVPTMFDKRTRASMEALTTLRRDYADDLWSSVIPVDTQMRDASRAGVPPPVHNPQARGVLAYTALLHDLQEGVGLQKAVAN